jgi:hypothetical protein
MINETKFNSVVEAAKTKAASSPAWQRCLDKASKMMASGELVVTLLAKGALVTSPNGSYHVTAGHCDCPARTKHCYHRCAVRIAELLDETEVAEQAARRCEVLIADIKEIAADVAASPRANIIAEIENIWPRFAPGLPLATELLARFGKNKLEMLDDDSLRRVRLAIAM